MFSPPAHPAYPALPIVTPREAAAAAAAASLQRRLVYVTIEGLPAPYVLDITRNPAGLLTAAVHAPMGLKPYRGEPESYNEVTLVQAVVTDLMRECNTYRVTVEADGDPCRETAIAVVDAIRAAYPEATPDALAGLNAIVPGITERLRHHVVRSTPRDTQAHLQPSAPAADPVALAGDTVSMPRAEAEALLAALSGATELAGMLPAWPAVATAFRALAGVGDTLAAVDMRAPIAASRVRHGVDTLRSRLAGLPPKAAQPEPVPAPAPPAATKVDAPRKPPSHHKPTPKPAAKAAPVRPAAPAKASPAAPPAPPVTPPVTPPAAPPAVSSTMPPAKPVGA